MVEKIKEDYAIALSVEPTMEEINDLPSDNRKGTELEMILMELKDLTINFTKNETKTRKDAFKGLTKDLTEAEGINDSNNAKILREKIKLLEEKFIEEECAKRKTYTILEDERPSQRFLNIESRKQGYNEVTSWCYTTIIAMTQITNQKLMRPLTRKPLGKQPNHFTKKYTIKIALSILLRRQ